MSLLGGSIGLVPMKRRVRARAGGSMKIFLLLGGRVGERRTYVASQLLVENERATLFFRKCLRASSERNAVEAPPESLVDGPSESCMIRVRSWSM